MKIIYLTSYGNGTQGKVIINPEEITYIHDVPNDKRRVISFNNGEIMDVREELETIYNMIKE